MYCTFEFKISETAVIVVSHVAIETSCRNGVTTRLNFTDTESMLSASSQSVAHVHNEESLHYKQHASQRTRFHVSSDLEKVCVFFFL